MASSARFQSTPPSREATSAPIPERGTGSVSIHAPLTGGDATRCGASPTWGGFQSTPPSREATGKVAGGKVEGGFQSTPPSREATYSNNTSYRRPRSFNPRPPHGRRLEQRCGLIEHRLFQSTPPSREATGQRVLGGWLRGVSIHAPLTGGDAQPLSCGSFRGVSIHAPLTGGDRGKRVMVGWLMGGFNPRPPHGRRQVAR